MWCVWDWVVEGVEVFCFVGGEGGGGGGGGHLVVCSVLGLWLWNCLRCVTMISWNNFYYPPRRIAGIVSVLYEYRYCTTSPSPLRSASPYRFSTPISTWLTPQPAYSTYAKSSMIPIPDNKGLFGKYLLVAWNVRDI